MSFVFDPLITAQAEVAALLQQHQSTLALLQLNEGRLNNALAELDNLRAVVARQTAQIADLQQQLTEAQREAAQSISVLEFITSLLDAVSAGSASLADFTVSETRVALRAALTAVGAGGQLALGVPTLTDPNLQSTVEVTIRPAAPSLDQLSLQSELAQLRVRANELQQALDRPLPPEALEPGAVVMGALAPVDDQPGSKAAWAAVAAALGDFAAVWPQAAAGVASVTSAVDALSTPPAAAQVAFLAAAVASLIAVLRSSGG